MKEETYVVIENMHIGKKYYMLKIRATYISENAKPGNFVMVKPSYGIDPLLKRPFGIYYAEIPFIWIYYEVVGRGTELMTKLKENDNIQILGPLGNYFPPVVGKNILMIAGGRGIAPIHYAIHDYIPVNNVFLLYGARSASDLNMVEDLKALDMKKMFLYTDDGSAYQKGFITTDIRQIIADYNIDVTFSCGPHAMLECLSREIADMKTKNYISLEARMGCGFGICHSCAVKTKSDEYKKVCTDGPIFKMEEIVWEV